MKNTVYVSTVTVYDLVAKEDGDGLDAYSIEKFEMLGYKGLQALSMAYQKRVKIGSGSDIIGPFQQSKIQNRIGGLIHEIFQSVNYSCLPGRRH